MLISLVRPTFVCLAALHIAGTALALDVAAKDALLKPGEITRLSAHNQSHKAFRIGLNKTVIIDLPEDARDVIVSNPEIATAIVRTPRRTYLTGLKPGETSALFAGHDGTHILTLDIAVERDLTSVNTLIRRVLPASNVRADTLDSGILLTGSVASPADAVKATDIAARFAGGPEHVVNMIRVNLQEQVLLKVTVAEVDRNALKRLGIDMRALSARAGNIALAGAAEAGFAVTGALAPAADVGSIANLWTAPSAGGALTAAWQAGSAGLQTVIEAMEQANLMRTLAEPSLISLSGETANFLAGGELPIPVSREKDTVSVDWKPFGVGLSFTPVVMTRGRISLKIATEVSDISLTGAVKANGFSIPSLKVRRASSTVELPSGGSLVMAGLLSDTVKRSADGVPALRELPVLGTLFESRDFTRSQTELVVIVTPYLVKATDRARLAGLPDITAPSALSSAWNTRVIRRPEYWQPDLPAE